MGKRLSKIYTRTGDQGETGLGDGSHKFSVTNAEHAAAVSEYLKRRRSQASNPPDAAQ